MTCTYKNDPGAMKLKWKTLAKCFTGFVHHVDSFI